MFAISPFLCRVKYIMDLFNILLCTSTHREMSVFTSSRFCTGVCPSVCLSVSLSLWVSRRLRSLCIIYHNLFLLVWLEYTMMTRTTETMGNDFHAHTRIEYSLSDTLMRVFVYFVYTLVHNERLFSLLRASDKGITKSIRSRSDSRWLTKMSQRSRALIIVAVGTPYY